MAEKKNLTNVRGRASTTYCLGQHWRGSTVIGLCYFVSASPPPSTLLTVLPTTLCLFPCSKIYVNINLDEFSNARVIFHSLPGSGLLIMSDVSVSIDSTYIQEKGVYKGLQQQIQHAFRRRGYTRGCNNINTLIPGIPIQSLLVL